MSATATQPQLATEATRAGSKQIFSGLGEWVESHPYLSLAILFAIFICDQLGYSLRIPRWHDELFTWYIAQAPSVHELLHLTSTIDLNPPLSYIVTRAVFRLFGTGMLQLRGPEMAGYVLAIICIFLFVRRRAGAAYGLVAATIVATSRATEPAIDGRPYGLMFGFGALALLAWQSCTLREETDGRTWASTLLLLGSLSALLLTHVFGVFVWGALVTAEIVRSIQYRRVATARTLALLSPLAATWFYIPILRLHAGGIYPVAFQAHPIDILRYYGARYVHEGVAAAATVILLTALSGRAWLRWSGEFPFTKAEWAAIILLLLSPVALILRLALQHASFFYRYADLSMFGLACLFVALLWRATARSSTPGVLATMILLIVSSRWQHAAVFAAEGQIFRHAEPAHISFAPDASISADLPIVVNSGIVFVEMNHGEPASLLHRTYYLTGGPITTQYTHANIFEGIPNEIAAFHLDGNSEPYSSFIRQHRHFYLLASDHDFPEDWLLRKLRDDGAHLKLAADIPNDYRDHDLYEVTMSTHEPMADTR